MDNLILIGGGGHCISALDVILSLNQFTISGIIDKNKDLNPNLTKYKYLGNDKILPNAVLKYKNAFITIGQIKSSSKRKGIFKILKLLKANIPKIVSPRAYVSANSIIGEGSIVMHDALINAGSTIMENCIINTKSLIEHEVFIGSHCHISTGVILNGGVKIEQGSFIGSNTVVHQNVKIGKNCVIASGSTVKKNLIDNSFTYGT